MLLKLRAIFWLVSTSPGGMAKLPCEVGPRHTSIVTSWFSLPLIVLSRTVLPPQISIPSPQKHFSLSSWQKTDPYQGMTWRKNWWCKSEDGTLALGCIILCVVLCTLESQFPHLYIEGNGFGNLYSPLRI